MLYYPLYRAAAEIYLLVGAFVALFLCIYGWVLLGRVVSRRLTSYAYWCTPFVIAASFVAAALLLELFVRFFAPRNYALASVVYLLSVGGLPFHLVSFIRLWQTISHLPPSPGNTPPMSAEQDETIWPPQPRRQS